MTITLKNFVYKIKLRKITKTFFLTKNVKNFAKYFRNAKKLQNI